LDFKFRRLKILVSGGTGYIGSHTVVELQQKGHEVVIVDNLCNSSAGVIRQIGKITGTEPLLEVFDLTDRHRVEDFFGRHAGLDGVIHFAAFKAVGESVQKPLDYYRNNLVSLMNILEAMHQQRVLHLVFSSSCTVYGQPESLPVTEEAPLQKALSPYGNTKRISEEMIADYAPLSGIKAVLLRYFNPIGAHPSALIGELPLGEPNNLLPYITQTAIGKRAALSVFGADYNTPDGTAIRDYIHVCDLANAHVLAMERLSKLQQQQKPEVFNLGTGHGNSVLEVIQSFERVSGLKLNYRITDRRPGDIEQVWADVSLAESVLGWKAVSSLDEMTRSAWNWEKYLASQ